MYPVLNIEEILNKYSILFAVYFGSYGTEFYNSESDIDIAVYSEGVLSSEEMLNLVTDLIIYHRKSEIDLINLRTADPIIKNEIARTGRILFEREEGIFERFCCFYIKQYSESKDYLNYKMLQLSKQVKEIL